MLFNSLRFALFFFVVTACYFATPARYRWALLLGASCYFYMVFVPAYILVLGFTIVIDYAAGMLIEKASGAPRKKVLLICSLAANVGVLAFFKYFNFLSGNLADLAHLVNWNYSAPSLNFILPIGLSFHTFQAMSYTIEVYRGRQEAEHHFGIYALYVMFYPQLVAGPIERPQHMLHQFREVHAFDYVRVTDGLKLMCWGLFQKAMIADRLAPIVDQVYRDPGTAEGPALVFATVLFSIQIFCDFCGYSSIAVGAAQVMGFNLMRNFDRPYLSSSIAEFWRRWHISLSSWFRDYVYFPLGGSRTTFWRWQANIAIVFVLSGLWHGASWNFVIWGALHAAYMIIGNVTATLRTAISSALRLHRIRSLTKPLKVAGTFGLVSFAWIFFRTSSAADALSVVRRLPTGWGKALTERRLGLSLSLDELVIAAAAIMIMVAVQLLQRRGSVRAMIAGQPVWLRWAIYAAATTLILLFGKIYDQPKQFIYFQF